MKLSDNLTYWEVIKSDTALRRGIDNSPTEYHLDSLRIVAENIFQPIREYFGKPIYVSSGYRSEALNNAIGGSPTSQHSKGQALDIDQDNRNSSVSNTDIFRYILHNLDFDQLIWEFGDEINPAWVHVSYNTISPSSNRKQVLVAYSENGRTKYRKYDA